MICIGSDHGGFELKKALLDALTHWNVEFEDLGCHDTSSVDYPELAHKVASGVASGTYERGVLICGTGLGMSYAANRHPGIRAAL
jgi:ribose 5-phosphate isomerase B